MLQFKLHEQPSGSPIVPPMYAGSVLKCTEGKEKDRDLATCIRVPHPAYANCPMKPFAVCRMCSLIGNNVFSHRLMLTAP